VGVDGIVGDETRQALMYKEPEQRVQFPMGESTNRKFQVSDNRVMGESVNMDYLGGAALLGLAALPGLAAEGLAVGATNTQIIPNVINSMGRMLPQARNVLNPTIPRGLPSTGGRFFLPQTPSAFGSRIGYNNGGPIDSLYQPTVTNNMLQSNVTPSVIQPNVIQDVSNPTAAKAMKSLNGGGTSSHSKSKERFRERSMGGDVSLSNTSFEVNGNPNTVDGNFYPQLNAKLDHGEVVKNNFVFSNRLRDTKTNKTFAKLALPIEKATGNAQKLLRVNPTDPFAKNTLSRNEQAIQSLTMTQENLASAAGLRGNSRGYATGGFMQGDDPIYMAVNIPTSGMGANRGTYYDPYNNRFLRRDFLGKYGEIDYSPGQDWIKANTNNIADHLRQYGPKKGIENSIQVSNPEVMEDFIPNDLGQSSTPNIPQSVPTTVSGTGRATTKNSARMPSNQANTYSGPYNPNYKDPYTELLIEQQNLGKYTINPLEPLNMMTRSQIEFPAKTMVTPEGETVDISELGQPIVGQRGLSVTSQKATTPAVRNVLNDPATSASTTQNNTLTQKFTAGDIMQGAEVLSKFGQLIGGAEVEKPYYDNTNISKNSFDPSQSLYQNQRNYSAAVNGLDAGSINSRRIFANSMLGQKLNSDNQTLSQYQQMNRGALVDYENRVSNQRRFNIGQTMTTNDINARNRSAFKEAIDVASTSVGNFGEALNAKEQGYDVLKVLKNIYPDVYSRIIGELNNKPTK
jgi:hypothetical protein